MQHDYTELMSAALDGRLTPRERAGWDKHLASCPSCQERWQALCAMDRLLAGAELVAPPPDFTQRVALRLAQEQAVSPRRLLAGVGLLAAGWIGLLIVACAQALLWNVSGGIPTWLGNAVQAAAQWWIFIRAVVEAARSIAHFIPPWGTGLALAFALLLIALAVAWWGLIWQTTGRQALRAPA